MAHTKFQVVTIQIHRIFQSLCYCPFNLNGRWMEVSQIRPEAHLLTTCNGLILLQHFSLNGASFPGLHRSSG